MQDRDFLYWVQGMLEYTDVNKLTFEDMRNKLQGIKDHATLALTKVTLDTSPVKNSKPFELVPKEPTKPTAVKLQKTPGGTFIWPQAKPIFGPENGLNQFLCSPTFGHRVTSDNYGAAYC
jgi:hypothetical protein